jgi:hypothetical protein
MTEYITVVVLMQYMYIIWIGQPIILSTSELQKIFQESVVLIHAEVSAVSQKLYINCIAQEKELHLPEMP